MDYDGLIPSGLKRFQTANSLHFVTFSCFHRLPLLEAGAPSFPFFLSKGG